MLEKINAITYNEALNEDINKLKTLSPNQQAKAT